MAIRRACLLLAFAVASAETELERAIAGRLVEEIHIRGLQRTKRETVLRQLSTKTGEPYRAGATGRDQQLLDRLMIFSFIEVAPREENGGVVVDVAVTEIFPYSAYPSISSTQENGLSLGPAVAGFNLFGQAVRGDIFSEFGGAANFGLRVRTPVQTQRRWWLEGGYSAASRDNTLFRFPERAQVGDLLAGYQFTNRLRAMARFTVLGLRTTQPGVTLNPSGRDTIPAAALGIEFDTRNLWTNATSGWFVRYYASRNGVGGDGGWWTHSAELWRYQPLSGRNTLALFSLASLQTGAPGTDLPTYMQYGIGGRNAIRGWRIDARTGKNQWLNTAEYRYELVKVRPTRIFGFNLYWGLQLAAFGDLGSAWTDGGDFRRNFIGSGGYGVRLVIPYVGMIRFDRAYGDAFRPAWAIGDRVQYWSARVR
jgi:outer membrane protein assembly factor BamA